MGDRGSWLNSVKRVFSLTAAPEPVYESEATLKRSTEDLRNTLGDLAYREMEAGMKRRIAANPDDASVKIRAQGNMSIGVSSTKRKIEGLQRDTLLAMLKAAENPRYFITTALRKDSNMAENEAQVRDVALFYDILLGSKLQPAYYGTALSRLRSVTGVDDPNALMFTNPDYARAVLRLVIHFTTEFYGPLDMNHELREALKKQPEMTDEIIAYASQRSIKELESVTLEALSEWKAASTPLRDGAL